MSIICILGIGNLSYAQNQGETPETSNAEMESPEETETTPKNEDEGNTDITQETAEEDKEKSCGSIQIIEKLQLEWSNRDEKGELLDQLAKLDNDDLQKCLCTNTDKELMGVTVMDLARHTNAELAKKATALVESFDPVFCVNEMLNSTDQHRYKHIVKFLLRIEPDQAKEIFDKVSFSENNNQDKVYMGKIIFENFIPHLIPIMLIPTASEEGDRYYVKTQWDPNNEEQLNCLSKLFKETMLAKRSEKQEKDWMKKLNGTRWAYWYSKEWAMGLAQGVTQCGANASFVKGPNS